MLGLFVKVHMFHVTGITSESVNDFFIEAYKCTFDLVVPLLFKWNLNLILASFVQKRTLIFTINCLAKAVQASGVNEFRK